MAIVKAQDPVCGMDVDPNETLYKKEKAGMTYFFCSQSCAEKFEQKADAYLKRGPKPEEGPARPASPSERSPAQENL